MPRYFFHLRSPDAHVIDPEGAEFGDADEAWEAARRTARTLMRTPAEGGIEWLRCSFEVLDDAGEVVFELPFAEAIAPDEPPTEH
jgi:hypothetical protein